MGDNNVNMEKEIIDKIYWALVDFYRKYDTISRAGFANELDFANTLIEEIKQIFNPS